MTKLNKIIKRKNKALNIFKVTKDSLTKVIDDTNKAVDESAALVDTLNKSIEQEQLTQTQLESEKTSMQSTVDKINSILGTDD